jgi:Mg-chelatase subunit ChlD
MWRGNDCCLDKNNNKICDIDEATTTILTITITTTIATTEPTTTSTTTITSTTTTIPVGEIISDKTAVVILIDISESMSIGVGGVTKTNTEKDLAINILQQLDDEDMVGAIAFNVGAYKISPMRRLGDMKSDLTTKISSLSFTGGTDMKAALNQADLMLEGFNGKKYVIVISDGALKKLAEENPTLVIIKSMNDNGIIIYSVGVGFDTNEKFMQKIAEVGKGQYFTPENYGVIISLID